MRKEDSAPAVPEVLLVLFAAMRQTLRAPHNHNKIGPGLKALMPLPEALMAPVPEDLGRWVELNFQK